jgi:hypothetical protein
MSTDNAMPPLPRAGDAGASSVEQVNAALTQAAYMCVYSRSDPSRPNNPIMVATHPLGELILRSGAMPILGAISKVVGLEALVPLLKAMPLGMVGVDVNEELHRFDVRGTVPDARRGVRAAITVGEAVGTLGMKWRIAPDDFEPSDGQVPPETVLDETRSQRFVMLDGRQRLRDGRDTGLRGFGMGRTFPIVVDGQKQLRIAAVVNVVEGFGNLAGLSGVIVVNGYVTPPTGLFINFVARLPDPDGHVLTSAPVSTCVPEPEPDPGTTFLMFQGEADPDHHGGERTAPGGHGLGSRVRQRLRLVHTGFDVASASGLRSNTSVGPVVGHLTADLKFDAEASGSTLPIGMSNILFTFTDPAGHVVGTLATSTVEGRAFRMVVKGHPMFRFGAFGPLSEGTGVFEGAVGMMTTNATLSVAPQAQSNLYVIRISDPGGRHRAPLSEALPKQSAADTSEPRTDDGLGDEDRKMLAGVDRTRRDSLIVQDWWREREAVGDFAERLELVREVDADEHSLGFFDTATVENRRLPVMGVAQEAFYDRPKKASAEDIRDQLREFVLGFFMRVSHRQRPEAAAPAGHGALPLFIRPFSWVPDKSDGRVGFGYEQLLYKLRDTGQVGKFHSHERGAIVDLRTIGPVYDWVVMRVSLFDFKVTLSPFGPDLLKMDLPLKEVTYLLMTPEMIVNRDNPSPDVLGEYGFGYGLLPYTPERDNFAYGPGHFTAGYQSFTFQVLRTGEIRSKAAFVVNRPDKMLSVDVDPIAWGFKAADLMTFNLASKAMAPLKAIADELPLRVKGVDPLSVYISTANLLTGGLAERRLGVSKAQLEKHMLVRHFIQHRQMLISSQTVWRQVPDWTDAAALPEFCRRGLADQGKP